jgi:hypothetical protein
VSRRSARERKWGEVVGVVWILRPFGVGARSASFGLIEPRLVPIEAAERKLLLKLLWQIDFAVEEILWEGLSNEFISNIFIMAKKYFEAELIRGRNCLDDKGLKGDGFSS